MIWPHLFAALLMLQPESAGAAAGPSGAIATPARAKANLAAYLSDADYPADAIRSGQQGTVFFRLRVTPEGLVDHCEVTGSSGSPSLDEATCRVMVERAQFTPARDTNGAAVAGQVEARIRWVLPKPPRAFVPPAVRAVSFVDLENLVRPGDYPAEARRHQSEGSVDVAIVVGIGGLIEQCVILESSGSELLDDTTCEIIRRRVRFKPARDTMGRAAYDIVKASIAWRLNRK